MPRSAVERFARTYSVRAPDDSYDSLGGVTITTLVIAPTQTDTSLAVKGAFANGSLFNTFGRAGSSAGVRTALSFTSGLLRSAAIPAASQYDNAVLSATLAGGRLS
jgi:hypothetical protein